MIIINNASYSNVSVTYTADGTQREFSFPFDYLRKAFVKVEVNEEIILVQGTDYTVSDNKTVVLTEAPESGTIVRAFRETPTTRLVSWADASVLRAKDMTVQQVQELHILEEQQYWASEYAIIRNGGEWNARNFPIKNVGDPVDSKDATNKEYVDTKYQTVEEKLDDLDIAIQTATEAKEAAEIAQERAEDAQDDAEAAKETVENIASQIDIMARALIYDNVASMKADTTLNIGQTTFTKGYYTPNDGGSSVYTIRAKTQGDVDDDGSIIFLDNNNVAELITDGTVNVKQFGAKGDGVTDDSTAIQNAINFGKNIMFAPEETFFIPTTLTLKDNITLDLCGGTLKAEGHNDVGIYANEFFICDSLKNITIKNGTLDSNTPARQGYVDTTDPTKVHNSLQFKYCDSITIDKCHFKKFLSNVDTSRMSGEYDDEFAWALAWFYKCTNITIRESTITDSAIEGWSFFKCDGVLLNHVYTNNTRMSTPINVEFCKNAKLLNSTILEDVNRGTNAGSTLNWYCQNSEIAGCYFEGGTGVDIGNELAAPATPMIQENLFIHDNIIKCGITSSGTLPTYQKIKDVKIHNNCISAAPSGMSIVFMDAENIDICNNSINGDTCVRIQANFANALKKINISNNIINGYYYGVLLTIGNGCKVTDFCLSENNFVSGDVENVSTGLGSFVTINDYSVSGSELISAFTIKNNRLRCYNSVISYYSSAKAEGLEISNNTISGTNPGIGALRGIVLYSSVKSLVVNNNNFLSCGAYILSTSTSVESLIVEGNTISGLDSVSSNKTLISLTNTSGYKTLVIRKNVAVNPTQYVKFATLPSTANLAGASLFDVSNNSPATYPYSPSSEFGSTASRPVSTNLPYNYPYYDTTLGKTIFYVGGGTWKDATGTVV